MEGYALLVGVNNVNDHYAGDLSLSCTNTDLDIIQKILVSTEDYKKENIEILRSHEATGARFLNCLTNYKIKSETEDGFLLIFFSGHGASFPIKKDETREFLCFHDCMVIENEIRKHLCDINPKFKIFFIINSCFSSGISNEKMVFKEKSLLSNLICAAEISNELNILKPLTKNFHLVKHEFTDKSSLFITKWLNEIENRKTTIQATFDNHYDSLYKEKIETFNLPYTNYKSEVYYLHSSSKKQYSLTGAFLEDASYFTHLIEILWNQCNNKDINYRHFYELLKLKASSGISPEEKIFPEDPTTYFNHHKPFITKSPKMIYDFKTLKQQIMEPKIELCECENQLIKVNIITNHQFDILYSETYDLRNQDDDAYINYLKTLLDSTTESDIRYLGVIEVRDSLSSDFPHSISRMWSKPDSEIGMVILHDSTSQIKVKGKKRTNGKVSNTLG